MGMKPKVAAIAGGVVLIAVPALVATPLLSAAGFTAAGIQAGPVAATVQSGMGSVVAPSLFSTLQSAAMGGYGMAAVHSVVQGIGAAVLATSWWNGGGDSGGEEQGGNGGQDEDNDDDDDDDEGPSGEKDLRQE